VSADATDRERARHRWVGLVVMIVAIAGVGGLHLQRTQQRGHRALDVAFVALAHMTVAHAAGDVERRAEHQRRACRAFRRAGAPWGIGPLVALGLDLCERWPDALDGARPPAPPDDHGPHVESALRFARASLLIARPADALPVLTTTGARRDHALRVYRLFAERWVNAGAARAATGLRGAR
jgi:hypothetical protein